MSSPKIIDRLGIYELYELFSINTKLLVGITISKVHFQ